MPMPAENADHKLRALWAGVDELLAGASLPGILAHQLGPLAANRLRRLGEPVPEALVLEERAAALCMLTATPLIERMRASCDGELVLIKGPEVAGLYPGSARRFGDIDVLTPNAESTQHALLEGGFVEEYDPEIIAFGVEHHLMPLRWPTLGLKVEVHAAPNSPDDMRPPPLSEILDDAMPSTTGVAGVSTPSPAHHALILTAHAWNDEPLWTLRDLIDVAATAAQADARELERTAEAWGMNRIWRTTSRTIEALFYGGRESIPMRLWARHLPAVRPRTLLERHLVRLLHGYWGMPLPKASVQTIQAFRYMIQPLPGESWRDKVARMPKALRKRRAPVAQRSAPSAPTPGRDEPPGH